MTLINQEKSARLFMIWKHVSAGGSITDTIIRQQYGVVLSWPFFMRFLIRFQMFDSKKQWKIMFCHSIYVVCMLVHER